MVLSSPSLPPAPPAAAAADDDAGGAVGGPVEVTGGCWGREDDGLGGRLLTVGPLSPGETMMRGDSRGCDAPSGVAAVKVTLVPVTPNQEMEEKTMSPGT